jgi:hypothetical protein
MSDTHLRLLRRVAAVRRRALRDSAATAPADSSEERHERLASARDRADAQLTAATNRRLRRTRSRRGGEGDSES